MVQTSVQKQNSKIRELIQCSTCEDGEMYFLIDMSWWKGWKLFVLWEKSQQLRRSKEKEVKQPGPIDNNKLLSLEGKLLEELEEDTDFYVLPKNAWELLVSW